MAIISEVEEGIFEIRPEGRCFDRFPLCTVYLVVDEEVALIEAGCPVQAQEITKAIETLVHDLSTVSYIIPTHAHPDHAGAAGHLVKEMPRAKIMAHQDVAVFLSDPSVIEKIMDGFKLIFGENAKEIFGEMIPVPKEKFVSIQYGESISLGKRQLQAIHTPGHDPYHLCFLDSMSGGLFCGDVLGAYSSEIDFVVPPYTPGTNFGITLESIQGLYEFHPTKLFFSHGCTVEDGNKYIKMAADNLVSSQDAAHQAILAGNDMEKTAYSIIDSLAKDSELIRAELSRYIQHAIMGAGAYRWYFKKMKMI